MNSQLTVAITLACAGVAQATLTLALSSTKFFARRYQKLLSDLTKTEQQFCIAVFFHDKDPGGTRIERVATVSGAATAITSQCVSLVATAAAGGVLAWVTWPHLGWFLGSLAITAAASGLCFILLRRTARMELLAFGMRLRGWKKHAGLLSLNSANPYVAVQILGAIYAAVVGLVL